jgi:amino acid transporter
MGGKRTLGVAALNGSRQMTGMWWKLGVLLVVTVLLAFAVIPFRTHAIAYDPAHPPKPWSLGQMLANMSVTPTALLLILVIVAAATFVAINVVRGRW